MRPSIIFSSILAFSQLSASTLTDIVLEGSSEQELVQEQHITFQGLNLPGGSQKLVSQLQVFLGQPLTEELLKDVKQTVLSHYQEEGYPFVVAAIPKQNVSKGSMSIRLLEGVVGEISYEGNKWFSDGTLGRFIHLKEGETIHQNTLLNDVTSLNRNHFHSTEVVVAPGKKYGTTDVKLVTQDRFPLRVYAGADNTGIDITGEERYFAGFSWGNAWGIGDLLTYQWTTAESPHLFNSHYLGYTSYFSWYHTLKLYGAYAEIHPKMKDFSSEGRLIQGSFRYGIPFKPLYADFRSEINIGADFKRTNSSLFFGDTFNTVPLVTKNVNLTQLALSYEIDYKFPHNQLTFNIAAYVSPAEWIPDQTKADFNSLRADAKPRYGYGDFSLGDVYTRKHGSIMALLRGQAATGPLLPSEQFGLGGFATVRGYDERDFDSDDAVCFNFELRSPQIRLFGSKAKNNLYFLAFFDYGLGHNYHNELKGIPATEYLMSAGPGVRLLMYPYLTARLDYGFQLHRLHLPTQTFGKLHFSLTASY